MSITSPPWAISLDAASALPVYMQVAQGLEQRIHTGELRQGSALPAERELAAHLHVSRVTVRQALALLAQQGLLTRKHGSGTFITPPTPEERPSRTLGLLSSFSEDVRSRGQTPGARVLSFEDARPTAQEVMSLALSPGERVYRVRRLRTSDGEALAVEDSTLPAALVGKLSQEDVTDASLYALLGGRGLQPVRAIRHLRAVSADLKLAELLRVLPGAALLATERVSWTGGGRPVEYARAHYRGDRYDFVMELHGEGE
ncbi:GntR family transcriptional regulator [Deinococcus arenicola]|uniref:GntR family transcriptional regulator n=1 Tax=Deinococcus arenicola TaxID=2994950 RepID=A0ABU4DT33_9DEIO|nr:GntR family transcriptional regulator [Deinococcus sp. ZS9-10]MDV6375601.1 GntR family transcriptional regulator [Deinococcus sp. ZS9-10]